MDALLELTAEQYALFTAGQWKGAGLSLRSLRRKVAAGVVREIYPSVFAIAGAPPSLEQQALAACLSVGGVASHRCAAYLWGFRRFEAPTVEVLVKKGRTPSLPEVRVRRTSRLEATDVDMLNGIPITGRARTLLDLCDAGPAHAEGALNGALHRRQVTVRQLLAVLDRVGPQHPGRVRYRELVLGVEIESVRAHAAREDMHRNASKANELLEWWILRFAFDDIHRWPEETAELIDRTIARRRQAA